jgi:hypothetical protein
MFLGNINNSRSNIFISAYRLSDLIKYDRVQCVVIWARYSSFKVPKMITWKNSWRKHLREIPGKILLLASYIFVGKKLAGKKFLICQYTEM